MVDDEPLLGRVDATQEAEALPDAMALEAPQGEAGDALDSQVPLLGEEGTPVPEAAVVGRARKSRVCTPMRCGACLLLLGLLVAYGSFLAIRAFSVFRHCSDTACFELRQLVVPDPCGTIHDDQVEMAFDVDVDIDLPYGASWIFTAFVDHVKVTVHSEGEELLRTSALTPVFAAGNSRSWHERKVTLGRSRMRLRNAKLLFDSDTGSAASARVGWMLLNQLDDLRLDIRTEMRVSSHALLFPVSSTFAFKTAYVCWTEQGPAGPEPRCGFEDAGRQGATSAEPAANVTLAQVDLHDTDDPRTEINVTSTVTVRVTPDMPAIVTSVPWLERVDLYVSADKLYPSRQVVTNDTGPAALVAAAAPRGTIRSDRAFNVTLDALVRADKRRDPEAAPRTIAALQMLVGRYLSFPQQGPFYMYLDVHPTKPDETHCFAKQVAAKLEPWRVEMPSIWAGQDPDEFAADLKASIDDAATLEQVRLENVTSEGDKGHVSISAVVKLPFSIGGALPAFELAVDMGERDVALARLGGQSLKDGRRQRYQVATTVQDPFAVAQQLYNFDRDTFNLTVHGTGREDLSLTSLLLKDLTYLYRPANSSSGGTSELPFVQARADVQSGENTVTAGLRGHVNEEDMAFQVALGKCFLSPAPLVVASVSHEGLEARAQVNLFDIGQGTRNTAQGNFTWAAADKGASLKALLDDFRDKRPTPLRIQKPGCVNVSLKNIPRLGMTTAEAGPAQDSPSWQASAELLSVTSDKGDAEGFNMRCAVLGMGCDQRGAGVSALVGARARARLGGSGGGGAQPILEVQSFPALQLADSDNRVTITLQPPSTLTVSGDHVLKAELQAGARVASGEALRSLAQASTIDVEGRSNLASDFVAQLVGRQPLESSGAGPRFWVAALDLVFESTSARAAANASATAASDAAAQAVRDRQLQALIPALDLQVVSNACEHEAHGHGAPRGSKSGAVLAAAKTAPLVLSDAGLAADAWALFFTSSAMAPAAQDMVAALFGAKSKRCKALVQGRTGHGPRFDVLIDPFGGDSPERVGGAADTGGFADHLTVELVGGVDPHSGKRETTLNIPCIVPVLCPDRLVAPEHGAYTSVYDLVLLVDVAWLRTEGYVEQSLTLTSPALAANVEVYVHTDLVGVSVGSSAKQLARLSDPEARLSVDLRVRVKDQQVLADSVRDVLDSVHPVRFSADWDSATHGLLPRLFQSADMQLVVEPTSPDGRPVPVPKRKQWWFPLQSVGAWRLEHTAAHEVDFLVDMSLPNPAPAWLRFARASGEVYFLADGPSGKDRVPLALGSFSLASPHSELALAPLTTSIVVARLKVAGKASDADQALCSRAAVQDPATRANCVVSSLMERIISREEASVLVQAQVSSALRETLTVNFVATLNPGARSGRVQPYKPAPRYAKDLPSAVNTSAIDEFISVFQTVHVDGWSTAWKSLVKEGISLAMEVVLHNPFSFGIDIHGYDVNFSYDDPTGEHLWYLPAYYPPKENIEVIKHLRATNLGMHLAATETAATPTQVVHILDHKTEQACRLYNAAEKVASLCGNLPGGSVDIALGNFAWRQRFSIFNVSLVGHDACHTEPWCSAAMRPEFTFRRGATAKALSLVGSASADAATGKIVLTTGAYDEAGAAWAARKLPVGDGFRVSFTFKLRDTAHLGGGDGFAFVVRRDGGPSAIGSRCATTPCNGFQGLRGPSVGVLLYRSETHHVELHGMIDGDESKRVAFASAADMDALADGKEHRMSIQYVRNDRKMYAYIDGAWVAAISVWEPADVDTGPCSKGSRKPTPDACVDMDAIAGGADGLAWVGFTATTGFTMTSEQTISDVMFENTQVDVARTDLLEKDRIVGRVGQPANFSVDLRDSCGAPVRRLGSLRSAFRVSLLPPGGAHRLFVDLVPRADDGILECRFSPRAAGTYAVFLHRGPGDASGHSIGNVAVWAPAEDDDNAAAWAAAAGSEDVISSFQ